MKLCILQYTQCIDSLCTVWFDQETQNATTLYYLVLCFWLLFLDREIDSDSVISSIKFYKTLQ